MASRMCGVQRSHWAGEAARALTNNGEAKRCQEVSLPPSILPLFPRFSPPSRLAKSRSLSCRHYLSLLPVASPTCSPSPSLFSLMTLFPSDAPIPSLFSLVLQ